MRLDLAVGAEVSAARGSRHRQEEARDAQDEVSAQRDLGALEEDRAHVALDRRGLELASQDGIRRLATKTPPSEPATEAELQQRIRDNAYSIPHVVGTCAMGTSVEAGAVVDTDGRVHGIDGLSVIDASIIPEPPSGFPHLITIVVAERLAARLGSSF